MDIRTKYNLLTHLPLLQGINGKELAMLENAIGLDVEEMPAQRLPLLRQGELCCNLIFIVSGKLLREYKDAEGKYVVKSQIKAPVVVEPENFFGLNCRYQATYYAQETVQLISIRKTDVTHHLMKNEIFRFNYLNLLSSLIQRTNLRNIPTSNHTAREKFARFLQDIAEGDSENISLHIKMTDLGDYLDETRLTISRMLRQLQQENFIEMARGTIHIRKALQ